MDPLCWTQQLLSMLEQRLAATLSRRVPIFQRQTAMETDMDSCRIMLLIVRETDMWLDSNNTYTVASMRRLSIVTSIRIIRIDWMYIHISSWFGVEREVAMEFHLNKKDSCYQLTLTSLLQFQLSNKLSEFNDD